METLYLYNTLTRKKEIFEPLHAPNVGMYVCGPTVYGDPHLGHARPAITFDLVFRYLKFLGYKVRYVRNITDVGHLENDADAGEDKIAKKARLERLEPMEVAQYYIDRYHKFMDELNVTRPSIEPRASGHIIEQIETVQKILDAGYAYVSNGSVYFDVPKYNKEYHYGKLSGRVLDELLAATRDNLDGQEEKRNPADFALWKKAAPEHIMRWSSPWSVGFPGWHVECTAMGCKYLGETFDIHGGGMDLMFPHHESEIAQACVAHHAEPAKYWMHNNMITIDGQKMGKSLGNFITLEQFFTGSHPSLEKAYSPMTIRFFILQAHYRSTVDFSNEALQSAEKGLKRLQEAKKTLQTLVGVSTSLNDYSRTQSGSEVSELPKNCQDAMNDDFNSSIVIANLFEAVKWINSAKDGKIQLSSTDIETLKALFDVYYTQILGLVDEMSDHSLELIDGLMQMILDIRQQAKTNKDYAASDRIRDALSALNITVKDGKEGASWTL
ncbi:MAG: cysteine--tRNA ligase [Bacteroidales bacterium]|jgi:cysteinyl-tRNA synthetase|nr:cysteine--tRNA ligase [Bacteroidales bacterium]